LTAQQTWSPDGSGHALMTGTPASRSTDGRETAIAALRVSVGVTVFSTQQPPRITLGITAEEVKRNK